MPGRARAGQAGARGGYGACVGFPSVPRWARSRWSSSVPGLSYSDALVLAAGAVLLAAALGGLRVLRRPPLSATRTLAGVRAVEVRLAAGRVEIGEDDRADARLELTVRRRVGRGAPRVVLADGTLRLDGPASEARVR